MLNHLNFFLWIESYHSHYFEVMYTSKTHLTRDRACKIPRSNNYQRLSILL